MSNYYPTESELSTPRGIRAAFQQVLKQHYELVDAHTRLQATHADTLSELKRLKDQPRPMGPVNSQMLGLPVQPVDVSTLANGAKLQWDLASGTFKFV